MFQVIFATSKTDEAQQQTLSATSATANKPPSR